MSDIVKFVNTDDRVLIPSSTLLSACFNENEQLINYLITISRVNIEKLVCMNQYEDHDNLTFYTAFSRKNEFKYEAIFNMTAPVLWHACRSFHIKIIIQLVKLGACVDSKSETRLNSTPLMAACAKNRLDVVKFLLEKGKADINATDKNGDTCLFYAVRHNEECLQLVEYLIEKNVNIAKTNMAGRTALDYSVHLKTNLVLDFLLAEIYRLKLNKINFEIALITAAISCDTQKFKSLYFYYSKNVLSPLRNDTVKIDSLEAIGVTIGDQPDLLESALMYWDLSIEEREKHEIKKLTIRSNEAFRKEFSSKIELNSIAEDPIEFQMQSIWIRHTILKRYKYATTFAEFNLCKLLFIQKSKLLIPREHNENFNYLTRNFKKLVKLWQMTLELQITYLTPLHSSTIENIYDFINYLKYVSGECLTKNDEIYSNIWLKLLKICLYELNRTTKEVKESKFNECLPFLLSNKILSYLGSNLNSIDFKCLFENIDLETVDRYIAFENINYHDYFEEANLNIDRVYRLIIYLNELNFTNLSTLQLKNEYKEIMKKLVISNTKLVKNGQQKVLSIACRPKIIKKDIQLEDKFSNEEATLSFKFVQYLLELGCDPNFPIDVHSSNTFLNDGLFRIESTGLKTKSEYDLFIELFLKHGAHLDFPNDNSLTLMDLYHRKFDKPFGNFFNLSNFISLKCLAANRIVKSGVYFHTSQLPAELVSFIQKHM